MLNFVAGEIDLDFFTTIEPSTSFSEENEDSEDYQEELEEALSLVGKEIEVCFCLSLGNHLQVFWPQDKEFYLGKVISYNEHTGKHHIQYPEPDPTPDTHEYLELAREQWRYPILKQ